MRACATRDTVPRALRSHQTGTLRPFWRFLCVGIAWQSTALRMEFAKAAAEVHKVAKQGTVRKYVERLQALYDTGDDGNRYIAGYAMNCLATSCLDKMQRYLPEVVPMAFMVRRLEVQARRVACVCVGFQSQFCARATGALVRACHAVASRPVSAAVARLLLVLRRVLVV